MGSGASKNPLIRHNGNSKLFGAADFLTHPICPLIAANVNFLTGFQHTHTHFFGFFRLFRLIEPDACRQQEVRTDRNISGFQFTVRLLTDKFHIRFHVSSERSAEIDNFRRLPVPFP